MKPLDCQLELPETLGNDDDDLTASIDEYEVGLNDNLETLTTVINNCFSSGGLIWGL